MKTIGNMTVTTPSDREIQIKRDFAAPRKLVFDAFTRPNLVKRWLLGPPGWTMPVCEIDLKVGGKYRYVWRKEDGFEMGMGGVFREIVVPERIVSTEVFDEDWTGGEVLGTLVLTEKNCKTTITQTMLYSSKDARDGALKTGMSEGMAKGYDRLAELLPTLGMANGPRQPGEFCWINMLTPNPDQAREFFNKVLGWAYAEMPGMGHRIQIGGRDVGGLFDLAGPNTPLGTPPLIGVMVKVESADAIGEKATSLGGKSMPAFDIGDQGRMAVCFDPNGANIDVWQPKKSQGTDADSSLHGAPSWFELLTTNADLATKFYSGLFGWTAEAMPEAAALNYTVFKHEDVPVAGMFPITPQMGNFPSTWVVYFTVEDINATVNAAVDLGAKICMTVKEVDTVGRFCALTSPQGVMFHVIQYAG